MEPDFSKYNLEELQEIKEALDKDKYPEKYSRLLDAIAKHPSSPIQAKTQESDYALRSLFKEYKKRKISHLETFSRCACNVYLI